MKLRKINYLVVHTTASSDKAKVSDIVNYFKKDLKWKNAGYHYIIDREGRIHDIEPLKKIANGVAGFNESSIHIAWLGGKYGIDNRTIAQKRTLFELLKNLKMRFKNAVILGHRDFQGVKKECPCFDALKEYNELNSL